MIFDLDCFHNLLSQEEGEKQLEILLAVFLQVEVVEVQEQEAAAAAAAVEAAVAAPRLGSTFTAQPARRSSPCPEVRPNV